jgi:hypothetical protein
MKYLLLLALYIPLLGYAQDTNLITQIIRGTIRDKVTQSPLPGATVVLLDTDPKIGTTTDVNGEFTLPDIPLGRVHLQISFIGFKPQVLPNLLLTAGKELIVNVELEEQAFEMNEVVVTVKTDKQTALNEMATASVRTFSIEETERYAGSLGDPSRMASNFAGVAMVNDSRNDIIIRGNSPAGLLWRLDGIEIPNPNHFGANGTTGGPVSMLNNNLLTNSDFFTGAFPAEYGNAMSGVFDLRMKSGNNQKNEFLGQVGFNGFELGAEGPLSKKHKGSFIANYRYSTLGLLNNIGVNFGTGTAIPQYQDLTFKIDLPTDKLGKFTFIGMGGLSYIELYDSKTAEVKPDKNIDYELQGQDLDYRANMGVIGLSHLYYFNQSTRLQTVISVIGSQNITHLDSLKFDATGALIPNSNYKFYSANSNEVKYTVASHFSKKLNSRNNFKTGFYLDLYQITFTDSVLSTTSPKHVENRYVSDGIIPLTRAYFQWQHFLSKKTTVNGGLYGQMDHLNNSFSLEPRLGIRYELNAQHTLNLAYGMHSQMQTKRYYFMEERQMNNTYVPLNQKMNVSKSQQIVLGYNYQINSNFRFKTETYYQYLYQIPITSSEPEFSMINTGNSFSSSFPDRLVNNGTGTNYGIEFTLEKFLSHNYYFLTTLSLFESKYKGYSQTERNTAFNGNFVLNVLGGYELRLNQTQSLGFDGRLVYAGGKRYVPVDMEASKNAYETVYNWDEAYNNKHDNYFRTDLRISFKMNGKKIDQEWAVDLQNFTNSKNLYSETYNPNSQRLTQTYQTGFFPMFLYRIRF